MTNTRQIVNAANYAQLYPVPKGETLTGLSETIPGQGITPQQIVSRYVNGKALPQLNGVYNDNPMLPDNFERLDAVQRVQLAHQMRAIVADRREKMFARRARPTTAPSESAPSKEEAPQENKLQKP